MLFYTGLVSTPNSIGIKILTTNEIICQINTSMPSGKETRKKFEKMKLKLLSKYHNILDY
jgi:hypothetical protein